MVSRAMGSNRRNDALASSHFKKRRELLNIIIVNSLRNSCKREGTQTRVEIETTLIRYCILERDLSNANTKNLLGTRSSSELGCRTGEKRWQRTWRHYFPAAPQHLGITQEHEQEERHVPDQFHVEEGMDGDHGHYTGGFVGHLPASRIESPVVDATNQEVPGSDQRAAERNEPHQTNPNQQLDPVAVQRRGVDAEFGHNIEPASSVSAHAGNRMQEKLFPSISPKSGSSRKALDRTRALFALQVGERYISEGCEKPSHSS